MKLVYFELENFLSIYNATGLHKLSFDRENSVNRIILILGANGSGKSSILDELSPLPLEHTNFRNKSRILKDKIGKKIIIFKLNDGYYYKCEIVYDKKTICYFNRSLDNKTWEELNKNGNVNTYVELLEEYLGFSKNYVKVGYLSSAISNFIIMKPSERNEYISEWLPNIDIYLKAHKIVTTKHNQKKREIDSINRELGKLSTINYENEIKILNDNKKELLINKEECIKNNAVLDSYLNKFISLTPAFNKLYDSKATILENGEIIKRNKEELNNLYLNNKDIFSNHNKPEVIQNLIAESNILMAKNNETLYNFNLRISKLKENIEKKQDKSLNIENENLSDVEARIEYTINDLANLFEEEETYKKINNRVYENCKLMNHEILSNLNRVIENLHFLFKNLSVFDDNLSIEFIENSNKYLKNIIEENKKIIIENEKEIENINKRLALKDNSEEFSRLFNLKPEHCSIQTCNLLRELDAFINTNNDLNNTYKLRDTLIKIREDKQKEIEECNEKIIENNLNLNYIVKINNYLMDNKDAIASFPKDISDKFNEIEVYKIKNNLDNILSEISLIRTIVHLLERIKSLEVELDQLKTLKIKLINENQLKEEYDELERLNNSVNLLKEEIDKINNRLMLLKNSANIFNQYKQNREIVEKQIEEYRISVKNIRELARCKVYYNGIKSLKVRKELDLAHYNKLLSEIESKEDRLKSENSNKKRLEEIRNEGLKLLRKYKVLSDTWSPKIGYASWEISAFLDILRDQTNRDLAEMWGSELKIESFNVDLNEFSIKINKNGNIIDDAILCSSGEQATLVTAISFAIIALNASSKIYNILRLDEVDAVLDSTKRRGFMDILIDRIEKMNCESCFVVTHNNEFDSIEADVILMSKTNEEMYLNNKNIIFKI